MEKRYLYLLIFVPFIYSCASRKAIMLTSVSDVKTDSVYTEKKNSVSVKQNAIVIKEDILEVVITPIDSAKPIIIGDVEYKNAYLKIRKSNKITIDSTNTTITETTDKKVEVKKKYISKTKHKKIDKKSNYFLYFWLLMLFILVLIAYKLRRLVFIK